MFRALVSAVLKISSSISDRILKMYSKDIPLVLNLYEALLKVKVRSDKVTKL